MIVLAACRAAEPPTPAELLARAELVGVEADLVHVTDVAGYTRAAGGLGAYGNAAFQDIYASSSGHDLRLTVERRTLNAAGCPQLPVPAAEPPGSRVEFEVWRDR